MMNHKIELTMRPCRYAEKKWKVMQAGEDPRPPELGDLETGKPLLFKGWEPNLLFEIGSRPPWGDASWDRARTAYVAVQQIENHENTEQGADSYLAQFWMGDIISLVFISDFADLVAFLSEISPIIQAQHSSLDQSRHENTRENLRRLTSGG